MDIALIVDKLVPGADYRRADDYAALVATWKDARPVPSLEEVTGAWPGVQQAEATKRLKESRRPSFAALVDAVADLGAGKTDKAVEIGSRRG